MDKYISDIFGYVVWVFLMVILLATGVGMFTANQIPQRQQNIERTIATTGGLTDATIEQLEESFGHKVEIRRAVNIDGKWVAVPITHKPFLDKPDDKLTSADKIGDKSVTYGTRVDYVMTVHAINIGQQTIDVQDPETHKTIQTKAPAFSIGEIKNLHSYGITLVK